MKKTLSLLLTLALALTLFACGGTQTTEQPAPAAAPAIASEANPFAPPSEQPEAAPEAEQQPVVAASGELVVFAAASLKETLTEIGKNYEAVMPGATVTFSFGSSGTLKTQIEEGADCDLFISAAPKQMNALQEAGLIDVSTRVDLLENKVALVVPAGNPKDVVSFEELVSRVTADEILIAIGNSDVPVGQYTQKIFEYFGTSEENLADIGVLTYGGDVKEVTTQVVEAAADCGVVYATDAFSAGLEVVDTATSDMCGQVIYPAAVLKSAAHPDAAAVFLDYLKSSDASAVFEAVGFTALMKQ